MDCQALFVPKGGAARCPGCAATKAFARDRRRGTPQERGYDDEYRRIRGELLSLPGVCCLICGSTEALTVDHDQPRSRGGSNDRSNLLVLCAPHNSAKGGKTLAEYLAHLKANELGKA